MNTYEGKAGMVYLQVLRLSALRYTQYIKGAKYSFFSLFPLKYSGPCGGAIW